MADERRGSPSEEVQRLYEEAETRTARAFEGMVSRGSFGELLARLTENVVGMTKISTDVFDLMLRNLRLAGRQDVTRLGRQLARTEDKLELVLQEVERLREQLDRAGNQSGSPKRARSGRGSSGNSSDGQKANAGGRASTRQRAR